LLSLWLVQVEATIAPIDFDQVCSTHMCCVRMGTI
jgi:hypothetical protein